MSQYGRYLNVTAGGSTWGVDGVGESANTALRVRFTIKLFVDNNPALNTASVRITNPNPQAAHQIVKQNDLPVKIDAGYADGHGVIFQGYMRQATYGRDNPTDTLLVLYCADSDVNHNFGVINKSFPPGSTPQDHVNAAVQAMASQSKGLPFALSFVDPAVDLTQPKYPKSVTLFGMAREVLANVARTKKANVFYDQGQVNFLGYGNSKPGGPVILNTNTGLIGMPTQEVGGVMARCLINPNIHIGSQVQIAQSLVQYAEQTLLPDGSGVQPYQLPDVAADGIYKVLGITYDGDTRGTPWYMDLVCIAVSQLANPSGSAPLPTNLTAASGALQQQNQQQ